jgi:Na+/H+ antiporter NhaD/arsenite permease-like protein
VWIGRTSAQAPREGETEKSRGAQTLGVAKASVRGLRGRMTLPFPLLATAHAADIPVWLVAPFVLLLLLIAVAPLSPERARHWWEHNYFWVSAGLAAAVAAFYLWKVPGGGAVLQHALHEYGSFIALIGSLFVVAGGIHLKVKGEATPLGNVAFLAVGAALANVIGTTGASMVLIRPWIRMNKIRLSAYHIVFFIFLVSNVGGALTPIGDPPLFIGFLRGVPFFWLVDHIAVLWLGVLAALLAVFYIFDRRSFRRVPGKIRHDIEEPDTWRFDGAVNVLFMLVVIGAVFLPATFFIREAVMIGAAVASCWLTPKPVHAENHFNFGPLKEVAGLFLGIFVTMLPALGWLETHGAQLGLTRPAQYYFASGGLSAVLDNAPTYASFLTLAEASAVAAHPAAFASAGGDPRATIAVLLEQAPSLVVAVSLGAVFFGAMTYIGNGPNFMVKAIAHNSGAQVPSFFGYIFKYSLPILLPILAVVALFL